MTSWSWGLSLVLGVPVVVVGCSAKEAAKPMSRAVSTGDAYVVSAVDKRKVVEQGDPSSYDTLSIAYLDRPFPGEALGYAVLMAHKYGHAEAFYDVSQILIGFYRRDISSIDSDTANMAMRYFVKAYEMGHHEALRDAETYSVKPEYDESRNRERVIRLSDPNSDALGDGGP